MSVPPIVPTTPAQEEAALVWLRVLHNQPGYAEQQAFSRWLQADPAHVEAYGKAQVLWELSEIPAAQLAAEDVVALDALLCAMDAPPPRRHRQRWAVGLAMAACLMLMISVGAGWQPQRWASDLGADYVSAPGQVRTVTLDDNSQVTLDADSAIAVNFRGNERRVQLRRGAAFFKVTHTGEPFVVYADTGETRVLGTEFEVRLEPEGAQVTVLSGRVGVKAATAAEQQILQTGQQVAYHDKQLTSAPRNIDSESLLAWRQGWLNYYRTPLADVVNDLSRYYPGRIVVLNDQLAARRISGTFPSKDPQAVLNALQSVVGFETYSMLGRVIVLR
ncbi:hypothetical protein ALQ04_04344 [Pseudomonas cichorii]|uniref:FecR family protein n=1 Tax=Pseudomonas cichorii TaxID=36746 RepID=A0A3M4MA36_PSECI|nr:FecR family protein [Pseudomonas cichorii]RMQ50670.1 hypothetical protein ALQ04_04344 [Pseudomonas cichorii]